MGNLGTILILLATVSFFIGLIGVLKGNVKFLKLGSRKASALFVVASFVVFVIGGFMLPSDTSTTSPASNQQKASNVEEKKTTKKEETKPPETTKETEEKKPAAVVPPKAETPKTDTLDGQLEVHFVDVGQGAAQVIIAPNKKVMVIDGGNNNDEDVMVAYLKQLGISKVDILIGTHPDADHIGGIDAVIDSFDIGKIYMPKAQKDTETFESVLLAVQAKGLKVSTAKAGLELDLDPTLQVKMIAPVDDTNSDANELSAVVRLQYGEQSFLLTGDIGMPTEEKLIQSGENLQASVLLVAHHGSHTSSSEAFIKNVQPKYAVIQVGKNSYGHPTSEVLDRLSNHKASIYRNDTDGTIVFTTDGKTIDVNKHAWVHAAVAKPKTETQPKTQTTPPPATGATATTSLKASATIDNSSPNQNEEVTVTVTVKDQNGKPVNGANVHLNLEFKSKDTPYDSVTNANGVATMSFKIGRAAEGFTVNGDITISYNGTTTTTETGFTPI
ncbi:MBL fold metallo-hydrolase [Paenisporosarcina indica]|uniref:MBL fold metallo-hydrolase n=1 Tax=Paenisporosarcina indica TaxID=650093 RepID=UPI0009502A0E|nr:MBL fold metallo-hydrolase [Paenisporosarcina indica]